MSCFEYGKTNPKYIIEEIMVYSDRIYVCGFSGGGREILKKSTWQSGKILRTGKLYN